MWYFARLQPPFRGVSTTFDGFLAGSQDGPEWPSGLVWNSPPGGFSSLGIAFLLVINIALPRVAKSLYQVILEAPKSTESGLEWPPMLVFVYA